MREQIVELCPNLENSSWTALFDNLLCDDFDECFPVRRRNRRLLVHVVADDLLVRSKHKCIS